MTDIRVNQLKPLELVLGAGSTANSPRPEQANPSTQSSTTPPLAQDDIHVAPVQTTPAAKEQLAQVQTQLAKPSPALSPSEIRRLLNSPTSLSKMQNILNREPALQSHFDKLGGKQVLSLIQTASQRPLKESEVKTLQRYLVKQEHAAIHYSGHATGIDGDYGKLTHQALVNVLASPIKEPAAPVKPTEVAPTNPKPETKPQTPTNTDVSSASVIEQLHHAKNLNDMARSLLSLPASDLQKLKQISNGQQDLGQLLQAAAQGPLSKTQIKTLQTLLVQAGQSLKYPGHATGIDGDFGARSRQALSQVVQQLVAGTLPEKPVNTNEPAPVTPAKPSANPAPEYERMLSDNLMDMTLAIGFDEGLEGYMPSHLPEEAKLVSGLESRGFVKNDARAKELLKEAGLDPKAEYDALYVKENIGERNGKPVHAVVRVVKSGEGTQGAAKRQAAIEGMKQSDFFGYGGHGRYGNGPDFDRNFTVTIDWTNVPNAPDSGIVTYKDYDQLKDKLGGNDAQATRKLKELETAGKVTMNHFNDGNIRMSETLKNGHEFGGQLTFKALEGVNNTLSQEIDTQKYKLWLFQACRTKDFAAPIAQEAKQNTALNAKNLDLITTEQIMYWENTVKSLLTTMDGVLAQENNAQLAERLTRANPDAAKNGQTHSFRNFSDNP